MKAIVQEKYGPPAEVLALREIERPAVNENEVLLRVRATCVHPDVWHAITGRPYAMRLMGSGVAGPKDPVPGMDVAGVVEAVGGNVRRFAPGDEVFGATREELQWRNGGAFAQYASVPENALALKPGNVSFEQAASVPISGYIAQLNLRGSARLEPGKKVLVNGAAGGLGSIAVQLGKAHGAHVTGVDHTSKLEMLRALGADEVVDYTREEVPPSGERYDLVLDVASNLTLRACKPSLAPDGVYLVIGHDHFGSATGRLFGSIPRMLTLMLLSQFVPHLPRSQGDPLPTTSEVMAYMAELLQAGKLTPVVDRTYPLQDAAEAMRYLESGLSRGRIVVIP